jgi:hypothetical protein
LAPDPKGWQHDPAGSVQHQADAGIGQPTHEEFAELVRRYGDFIHSVADRKEDA